MSHVINYWNQPVDKEEKEIRDEIFWEIYDTVECEYPDEDRTECGYAGMAGCAREIIFKNRVFENEEAAYDFLRSQSSYCNMAVKYKDDKGQLLYLIRTEYHC